MKNYVNFVAYSEEEKLKRKTQDFRTLQWSLLSFFFLIQVSPLYGLFCKLSQCNSFHPWGCPRKEDASFSRKKKFHIAKIFMVYPVVH